MTYFLDFDRTLFDIKALYQHGIDSGAVPAQFVALLETAVAGKADYSAAGWDDFFGGLEREEFEIIPADASSFVYEDAKAFLAAHGHEVVVVTAGRVAVQKRKVERSGIANLVKDVVYSGYEPKGEVMARKYSNTPSAVFVDDKESQLQSVKSHIPQCAVFQIVRSSTTKKTVMFPVIKSLTELP